MPVDTRDPKYAHHAKRWAVVRAIVDNDAKEYIRTVDHSDIIRSRQYREDAILTNFTGLTKSGLTGLVFRKAPVIEIPTELEYLLDDATGENMPLDQYSQRVFGELLQTGRHGILVDYPPIDGVKSVSDIENMQPIARFKSYPAETIINWKMKQFGNKLLLGLLTLWEKIEDPTNTDKFESPMVDQYRVLELDKNCEYCVTVYDANDNVTQATSYPTKADGSRWNWIPFQFIGAENNDVDYDPIPLYDLAMLNLGHYRNSADYEESVFVCGQPMGVWSIDGSPEEFAALNPGGILWGCRRGVNVGPTGKGVLLQANANQLADAAMSRKETQAAALGARMITPPHGRETAEAARIRYGSQNSALYTMTTNQSLAFIQILEWAAMYQGADATQINFKLNDVFYDDNTDPQMLMAMMQGYDRGFILPKEIREYMKETGAQDYLTATDAQITKNIHTMQPIETQPIIPDNGVQHVGVGE